MKLTENPIFITQRRITHRGGVLAGMLIAGVLGFCLLVGFIGSLTDEFGNARPAADMGRLFYGWIIGLEILVLVLGGFAHIVRVLTEDRKAGLWDSNRLTPMSPAQILTGYWFGAPLREFYMGLVLAGFGLVITLSAGLPPTLWLGTQLLILSTAAFFGLLALLMGMAFQRAQGLLVILLFLFTIPVSFLAPSRLLTNYLLPTYGIGHLFIATVPVSEQPMDQDWTSATHLFGLSINPVLLSLILQASVGVFLWRTLVRKTANPFQPLMLRGEAVGLFTWLTVAQQALIWSMWLGIFPTTAKYRNSDDIPLIIAVHGGTLLLGLMLLASASPQPERVRVESLRLGFTNFGPLFSRSAAPLALALAGIAAVAFLTQFLFNLADSWRILLVVCVNLTEVFLLFVLVLEYCRLRHRRRHLGFVALWLVLSCVAPLILALAFQNAGFARFSMLAPGFIALAGPDDTEWPPLFYTLMAHMLIVILLGLVWRRRWLGVIGQAESSN